MDKKKYIIMISVLVLILGVVTTILIIKGPSNLTNEEDKKYGEEHKKYSNTFNLKFINDGDDAHYVIEGLTTYGSNELTIEIPDTIDGYKVTKLISYKDFSDFSKVETIKIGKNISFIGTKDEEGLGNNIFMSAFKLKKIIVDAKNEVYSSIDDVLYNKDKSILIKYPLNNSNTNITIRTGVVTIYEDAFNNNAVIEKVYFPSTLKIIKDRSFNNCKNLSTIEFNNVINLKEIGDFAFSKCSSLSVVKLPNGIETIGNNAFANCYAKNTKESFIELFIPSSVINFGERICYNTSNNPSFVLTTVSDNLDNLKKYYENFNIDSDDINEKIKISK